MIYTFLEIFPVGNDAARIYSTWQERERERGGGGGRDDGCSGFIIYAFVQCDNIMKQVPMLFVLVSR